MKAEDISGGVIVDGVAIICPYCGLKCAMGIDANNEGVGFHEVPACKQYLEMELDDYLVEARKKIEQASKHGLN